MGLTSTGGILHQNALAGKGRVSSTSAIGIASNISVRVTNIVLVFGVELIVGKALERLTPEKDTLIQAEANALEEQSILKTAKMFQVVILAKCCVKTTHAQGKVHR